MQYETKFNIEQTVCFKDHDGGVKRGTIIGVNIKVGWHSDNKSPSNYELTNVASKIFEIFCVIQLEQPSVKDAIRPVTKVSQERMALTFEDAWALR